MTKHSAEPIPQFEQRKADHIRLALDPSTQAIGYSGLEQIRLRHEAIPDIDFADADISTQILGHNVKAPLFISSMTAGHAGSVNLNQVLAEVCEARQWAMGVGSQRRQLQDPQADQEWRALRNKLPQVKLLGNIGVAQLIATPISAIQRLVDSLEAIGLFVHTNPIQECLQPEGTPQFKGSYQAIEDLCKTLSVPVIIKETGCGFSEQTLERLKGLGIAAVDVSGFGGTHWGRIEGGRSDDQPTLAQAAETFKNWGISTVGSLLNATHCQPDYAVWASGGVRSGLDAAKLIAMGARLVGIAKPALEAALAGPEALDHLMATYEYELRMALFCTGCSTLEDMLEKEPWQ